MPALACFSEEASLEEEVEMLRLENALFRSLLQRAGRDATATAAAAGTGLEPLLVVQKQELCAAEAAATRLELEQVQADGELERACARAGVADAAGQQAAETARDLAALLAVLGLPVPPRAEAAAAIGAAVMAAAAAPPSAAAPVLAGEPAADEPAAATSVEGEQGQVPQAEGEQSKLVPKNDIISCSALPADDGAATAAAGLALPSARQLARADFHGGRLSEYMQGVLERHDANVDRLQLRNAMLQAQLAKVEASLGAKAEMGAGLRKVDFDALRIEHSQAEAALQAASEEAVALKAQVSAATQRLADQRAALAAATAEAEELGGQVEVRAGQVAAQQGEAAKVQREWHALERECIKLGGGQKKGGGGSGGDGGDGQEGGKGGGSRACSLAAQPADNVTASSEEGENAATILEYLRLKNACTETAKRIADWQRKLEVQAGRRAAAVPHRG